jgi:hypothetical protein
MALPPLAQPEDLEYRLGREFTDVELPRVEAVLDDVSALVRAEAGRSWVDPVTGLVTGLPDSVRTVVLRVAERVIRNPQGFRSESAGDYSFQRYDADAGPFLSDREIAIIRRAIGRTGLWTQRVERDDPCDTTLWAEDSYGAELFPITAEGDWR